MQKFFPVSDEEVETYVKAAKKAFSRLKGRVSSEGLEVPSFVVKVASTLSPIEDFRAVNLQKLQEGRLNSYKTRLDSSLYSPINLLNVDYAYQLLGLYEGVLQEGENLISFSELQKNAALMQYANLVALLYEKEFPTVKKALKEISKQFFDSFFVTREAVRKLLGEELLKKGWETAGFVFVPNEKTITMTDVHFSVSVATTLTLLKHGGRLGIVKGKREGLLQKALSNGLVYVYVRDGSVNLFGLAPSREKLAYRLGVITATTLLNGKDAIKVPVPPLLSKIILSNSRSLIRFVEGLNKGRATVNSNEKLTVEERDGVVAVRKTGVPGPIESHVFSLGGDKESSKKKNLTKVKDTRTKSGIFIL